MTSKLKVLVACYFVSNMWQTLGCPLRCRHVWEHRWRAIQAFTKISQGPSGILQNFQQRCSDGGVWVRSSSAILQSVESRWSNNRIAHRSQRTNRRFELLARSHLDSCWISRGWEYLQCFDSSAECTSRCCFSNRWCKLSWKWQPGPTSRIFENGEWNNWTSLFSLGNGK